jgi:hypothetical protein
MSASQRSLLKTRGNLLAALIIVAGLGSAGCTDDPSRLAAPNWDPAGMATQAMADLDNDGDGKLYLEELEAAPGLKYCAKLLDAEGNGDGSLSREEIVARLTLYRKMRVGLTAFDCRVMLNKRPLVGAKVRLVPEPFLGKVVGPQESTSKKGGWVKFSAGEGINMSVAPVCMYRVEITSPDVEIPEKYNTKTTLGVEVSAMTDPYHLGPIVFQLLNK